MHLNQNNGEMLMNEIYSFNSAKQRSAEPIS